MYERKSQPLLSRHQFMQRLSRHALFALLIIVLGLAIGIVGYMTCAQLDFLDATLNAAMILSSMGPVSPLKTDAAKIFASVYALFSGFIFLGSVSIVAAPIIHRLFHHFHVDEQE